MPDWVMWDDGRKQKKEKEAAQVGTAMNALLSTLTLLQVMWLCLDCISVFQKHQTNIKPVKKTYKIKARL